MNLHIHVHGRPGTGKTRALGLLVERLGPEAGVNFTPGSKTVKEMLHVPEKGLVITTGYQPDPTAACNVDLNRAVSRNFSNLPDDVWSPVKAWVDKRALLDAAFKEALDAALSSPRVANRRSRL